MYSAIAVCHRSTFGRVALACSGLTLASTAGAQSPSDPSPGEPPAPGEVAAPAPPQPLAPTEPRVPPAEAAGAPDAATDTAAIVTGVPATEPPASATAPAGEARAAHDLPAWLEYFSIGGGLILYYYQPLTGESDNNVSVFFANLLLDGKWDTFGLHVEPRFRDTKLRSFFDGPAWLQEAYASGALGPVTVKVGKSYKRLGLFWDNSFYGNVQVYDGLKLDPNYGISVEGDVGETFGLDFSLQYFVVDGGSNVSLANRDTLYVPGARRRNAFVGRVAPVYHFAAGGAAHVGVSAEHFSADLPGGEQGVTRVAGEAKLAYDGWGAWAELLVQKGRHVTDFPYASTPPAPGRASGDNRYLLFGGEYSLGLLSLRYNVSFADYADVEVSEWMHVPALGIAVNEHLSVLGEYVHWTRDTNEGEVDVDESLNLTLNGHF